jgi:uncharacterized protein YdeI (BOF family)
MIKINKKGLLLSAGLLLGVAVAAGLYAAQGQSGSGPASGQPSSSSSDTDMKSGTQAQPGAAVTPGMAGRTATIEGEVLRIKGEYYVIKDAAGKEVQLHVDKSTKLDGNIVPNDRIVARASEVPSADATAPDQQASKSAKSAWHADSIKKR